MSGRLALAARIVRLMARLPGLLMNAERGYRHFERQFVAAAVAKGLPQAAARELARELKPTRIVRELQAGGAHAARHRKWIREQMADE